MFGLSAACRSAHQGPLSDHFDGKVFYNPWKRMDTSFSKVLKWKLEGGVSEWPEWVENKRTPDIKARVFENDLSVTFINHASFLIQVGGQNILTDPIWSERTSPVSFAGPKRVRSPGLAYENLPPIDIVLVSHNHYDHLDLPTLQRLSKDQKPRIFVPLNDKPWLEDSGVGSVSEMDWWESVALTPELKLHFAPAQHWSSRTPFDRNKSLWGSFILEYRGQAIYFAGDTGYGPHYKWVQERFANMRLAFIPIGAYEPRWFMGYQHGNPHEAVIAHRDLKAKTSIGMHFACFQLTNESIDKPAEEMAEEMNMAGIGSEEFIVPEVGASYHFKMQD